MFPRSSCTSGNFSRTIGRRIEHSLAVAVRGVDDQRIHAGVYQRAGTLEKVARRADRRGNQQAAVLVLGRDRILPALVRMSFTVIRPISMPSDPPREASRSRCFAMIRSASSSVVPIGAVIAAAGHRRVDRLVETALELQVAVGDDADQAIVAVRRSGRPRLKLGHQRRGFTDRRGIREGDTASGSCRFRNA